MPANDSKIDLKTLARRESEQVEWKEGVASPDNVVKTLSAFANDLANLGGGYVVCGAEETLDEQGFPKINIVGLTASRLKEIEGQVFARCREKVTPPIVPLVEEIETDVPDRRVLVFIMPATSLAHVFRSTEDSGKYYVRISRETREARNGLLRELLVRKNAVEPWDRRPCPGATVGDLDLLALRDLLQRIGVFDPGQGVEPFLSDTLQISAFVPPLCIKEPLTGKLTPRNFAMLLCGRYVQRFCPGGFSTFSIYPGHDRSEAHAERVDLDGTLVNQINRLVELLNVQSITSFDKEDPSTPNAVKYPRRALQEAAVNALAHRDYEQHDPVRTTVFVDRIEIASPGPLPLGMKAEDFKAGRAGARWRNQALAWFLGRLQMAQAEGQGIPTILRTMREEGCPPPDFDIHDDRLVCILPAHPRHALVREYRTIEEAISTGDLSRALAQARQLLDKDRINIRAVQLFTEVVKATDDLGALRAYLARFDGHFASLPARPLLQMADTLSASPTSNDPDQQLARTLYNLASQGRLDEREARRVAIGLERSGDPRSALEYIDQQTREHTGWSTNPAILQARGNAQITLSKLCGQTYRNTRLPIETRQRAWDDSSRFLEGAERDLLRAAASAPDRILSRTIHRNLEFIRNLRSR